MPRTRLAEVLDGAEASRVAGATSIDGGGSVGHQGKRNPGLTRGGDS